MAYLSPYFDYDIFVSYSHGDPKGAGESPLKTWSHALIEALIADITSLSDEFDELAVWYDRDLDPTLQLTPELRRKVKASAVLMILISPRYLKSAWCGDERTWFQEQIEDRAADEGRIFIIRVLPTDEGTWPDFLRDERGHAIVGFRFYPPPRQPGDIIEPFGWPDLIVRNEPFRRELAALRTVLTRRLRELKKSLAGRATAPPFSAIPGRGEKTGQGQSGGVNIVVGSGGGDFVGRDMTIGIPPDQIAAIVEAVTSDWKRLTDEQRKIITELEGKIGGSAGTLEAFFRTLGEADVPPERQEAKRVEIAERYKQLVGQVSSAPGDDPEVAKLKGEAKAALDAGQLERADALLEEAYQYYSCFISYSSKDEAFARRLYADLQNSGVRCWFAPHDLPIGAKTWDAIDAAIRVRDKLLLILSKNAIASDWVEDEVGNAFAEERRRNQVVLFPVRIDDTVMKTAEPWAVKLRDQRNIGDFRRWKDHDAYQQAFSRVLRDLKAPPG